MVSCSATWRPVKVPSRWKLLPVMPVREATILISNPTGFPCSPLFLNFTQMKLCKMYLFGSSFFSLSLCFWDSCLYMSIIGLLSLLCSIPVYEHIKMYPFHCWWAFVLFPFGAIMHNNAMNIPTHAFWYRYIYIFFFSMWYIAGSRITRLYSILINYTSFPKWLYQ